MEYCSGERVSRSKPPARWSPLKLFHRLFLVLVSPSHPTRLCAWVHHHPSDHPVIGVGKRGRYPSVPQSTGRRKGSCANTAARNTYALHRSDLLPGPRGPSFASAFLQDHAMPTSTTMYPDHAPNNVVHTEAFGCALRRKAAAPCLHQVRGRMHKSGTGSPFASPHSHVILNQPSSCLDAQQGSLEIPI